MNRPRSADVIVGAAVFIATFVAFIPALSADFVSWDDPKNFLTNPHYRGLGLEQLRWMWSTFLLGHYVPLSWMTLGLDYTLWGMDARGYHATNVIIHSANAVLVFVLAKRLLRRGFELGDADSRSLLLASAATAAAYALHPLRVESVAWVTERRDLVSMFFALLTVLLYLRYAERVDGRRRYYGLALVAFGCAVLSKGTAVTIPAVLLLLSVYPLRRIGGASGWFTAAARRVVYELIPFGLIAIGIVVLTIRALDPPPQLPIAGKAALSVYSVFFYLAKTLVPASLSPLYAKPVVVDAGAARFVAAYGVVLALGAAAWLMRRRWPGVVACLAAFVVISLPMLGIVQNGPQIAADRYTYHAGPALAMLAGVAVLVLGRRSLAAAMIPVALGSVALGALTWRQCGYWQTSERLWARVVEIEPDSPVGNSAIANILLKQNRPAEAIEHSLRAIAAAPEFPEGHNDLGVGLAQLGRHAEAIQHYRRALSLKPRFDQAENNLGILMARLGEIDSAVVHYQRALALNPENAEAEVNWGNALVRRGNLDEAIRHYQRALWIRPRNADAHHNWGVALARQGRFADAVMQFQQALSIEPAHAEARQYLGMATKLAGRPPARD